MCAFASVTISVFTHKVTSKVVNARSKKNIALNASNISDKNINGQGSVSKVIEMNKDSKVYQKQGNIASIDHQ